MAKGGEVRTNRRKIRTVGVRAPERAYRALPDVSDEAPDGYKFLPMYEKTGVFYDGIMAADYRTYAITDDENDHDLYRVRQYHPLSQHVYRSVIADGEKNAQRAAIAMIEEMRSLQELTES